MGVKELASVLVKKFNNEIGIVPEGFANASFKNMGNASASLTQNGQTFTLGQGEVFSFGSRKDADAWMQVEVDATGTVVECVYYR
jgi:hypothetical protein